MADQATFRIWRGSEGNGKFVDYTTEITSGMVVLDAVHSIQHKQANDIAVGVESILGIEGRRAIAPVRTNVACHHLNYFVSESGQKALSAVQWSQAGGTR